jgi:Xaa-Pro aminopeptidase
MAQMKPKVCRFFVQMIFTPIGADSSLHSTEIFFYFVDQEESILLFFLTLHKHQNIILKETNAHIAVWEGEKLTKERALAVSGIKTEYIGCKISKNLVRNDDLFGYNLY